MAPGWVQQTIQLPEKFRAAMRGDAGTRGHSSIKTLGTAAVGILLGMPDDVRHVLYLWTHARIIRHGADVEPREIYAAFKAILAAEDAERARIALHPGEDVAAPDEGIRRRLHDIVDRMLAQGEPGDAVERALLAIYGARQRALREEVGGSAGAKRASG